MVITVNIRYTGKNSSVRYFLQEMEDARLIDMIRDEPGNLRYEYYWSLDDPDTVLIAGSWQDRNAYLAHLASPVTEIAAGLRKKYDISMTVERYIRVEDVPSDKVQAKL